MSLTVTYCPLPVLPLLLNCPCLGCKETAAAGEGGEDSRQQGIVWSLTAPFRGLRIRLGFTRIRDPDPENLDPVPTFKKKQDLLLIFLKPGPDSTFDFSGKKTGSRRIRPLKKT